MACQEDNDSLAYLNEHHAFVLPTPQQRRAINVLRAYDTRRVLAWLEIMRCLEPEHHYLFNTDRVGHLGIDALSIMSACDEDQVETWLKPATCKPHSDTNARVQLPRDATNSTSLPKHGGVHEDSYTFKHTPAAGLPRCLLTCTKLTDGAIPITSLSQDDSKCDSAKDRSAGERATDPSHLPACCPSPHEALKPAYHNNVHNVDTLVTQPTMDTGSENLYTFFQPTPSELRPYPNDYALAETRPPNDLQGIGAWQADQILGFTGNPSPTPAGEHADGCDFQARYPDISDV